MASGIQDSLFQLRKVRQIVGAGAVQLAGAKQDPEVRLHLVGALALDDPGESALGATGSGS